MLCTSRTRGTLQRRGVRALANCSPSSSGSTWTTTSLSRQRRLHRLLDRVRGGVALPDRAPGRHADDDVREMAAGRLAHPQSPQVDGRLDAGDRGPRGRLRAPAGARSMSTSTFGRISRAAATSTSAATKSAATESACG